MSYYEIQSVSFPVNVGFASFLNLLAGDLRSFLENLLISRGRKRETWKLLGI